MYITNSLTLITDQQYLEFHANICLYFFIKHRYDELPNQESSEIWFFYI